MYDERCDYDGHEWRCGVRMLTMMMMRRRKPAIDDEDDAARVRMMVKMMHREMHGVGVGGWGVGGMMMSMMRRWCKMVLMMMPVVWGLGRDWRWRWWCAGGGADDDDASRIGGRRGAK